MRIAVILEETISDGGGFNQALNAIIQIERLSQGKFSCLILTSHAENLPLLKELGVSAIAFRRNFGNKVIGALGANPLTRRFLRYVKWTSPFENLLLSNECDLAYFVTPTSLVACLQRLNYILTIWDNCHRDFPEFPEVRSYGEFMRREFIYNYINQAYLILVDSEELAILLSRRYGVDRERLLTMPFGSNPLLKRGLTESVETTLQQYGLSPGFFLYPAQFWPHKNHLRIVQALALLTAQGKNLQVVFVGGDKGNRETVTAAIAHEGLQKRIVDLGFVPTAHLQALYQGCSTVIMPTYFGPTNIPPLESWQARRPLIYSQHLAHQCGDAALLIDPDDPQSLASAMLQSEKAEVRSRLVMSGEARLATIDRERDQAEVEFTQRLKQFGQRLSTWLQ